MHHSKPDGQPAVSAAIAWPTCLNGFGGISIDRDSQLLTRLGRVRGNIDRVDGDNVVGGPYVTPFASIGWVSDAKTNVPQSAQLQLPAV